MDTGLGPAPIVDLGAFEHQTSTPCPADLDGNGEVAFGDLLVIITAWGACAEDCPEDLDGNGSIGFGDMIEIIMQWGECG